MKRNSFKWSSRKLPEPKVSFNKIQSWLEQLQSVQNTQRMLLQGRSRQFQGSMLKSKSTKNTKKQHYQNNLIEIDNETKVFKISSFEQNQLLSKTFTPFKKQARKKPKFLTVYSQGISPRENSSNQMTRTLSPSKQRSLLKLNTKQLLFKMKKIKKIESTSEPKSTHVNKDKIQKILSWKAEIFQRSNGVQSRSVNQNKKTWQSWSQKKIRTLPSTSKIKNRKIEAQVKEKLEINNFLNGKDKNGEKLLSSDVNNKQIEQRKIVSSKQPRKQKVDPRIKLQLQITQKLFSLQQNSRFH